MDINDLKKETLIKYILKQSFRKEKEVLNELNYLEYQIESKKLLDKMEELTKNDKNNKPETGLEFFKRHKEFDRVSKELNGLGKKYSINY